MTSVLLVDDEPLIAELIEEALRDHGLEVRAAHSGRDAVAALEAEPQRFAAVVTDINLGDSITGFEVAQRARALNGEVKVVYVTGRPSNIFAADEQALMFPKPFDVYELADQVRLLLARHLS